MAEKLVVEIVEHDDGSTTYVIQAGSSYRLTAEAALDANEATVIAYLLSGFKSMVAALTINNSQIVRRRTRSLGG